MRIKPLILCVALVLLAALPLLSAKSYNITFTSPTAVGNLQLPAGDYKLTLSGNNAVFTNVANGRRFSTPVKVVDSGSKYSDTVVEMKEAGGIAQLVAIDLGGSRTQLKFGS